MKEHEQKHLANTLTKNDTARLAEIIAASLLQAHVD